MWARPLSARAGARRRCLAAGEAARRSKAAGKATLSSREVQSAVRLVLPGELGRHAMSEGTKAISKYMSYDDA